MTMQLGRSTPPADGAMHMTTVPPFYPQPIPPFPLPEGDLALAAPWELWRLWQANSGGADQAITPALPVSGLGLADRTRAAKLAATLRQVVAFAQNQPRAWTHGDIDEAQRVTTDIKALLDASESDLTWLAKTISDKQQQFELAFAAGLAAAPVTAAVKAKVAAGLLKRGGVAELALEGLAQFRDPEARAELIGNGKLRLSSLGAFCMGSAALAGAELATGSAWGAAATAIGMASAGCLDL